MSMAACRDCRRRSWLLGELSALLDYQRGDPLRLVALLELSDEQLIDALGGRRREALKRQWEAFTTSESADASSATGICRHDSRWPTRLGDCPPPAMLWLTASLVDFERLLEAPTVALLGSRSPTPYGAAMAASLARGLAAAGVTIISTLTGALAVAAQRGVLEARGHSLAVAGDGLARIRPATAARLARELTASGCVISELPPHVAGRGWGTHAAQQSVAALAEVAVMVEAEVSPTALMGATSAAARGRRVAALPGPVTSSLSAGPNSLIRRGTSLVRDAGDVLELLSGNRSEERQPTLAPSSGPSLRADLREVLLRVGAGEDTPERLTRGAVDPGAMMAALGELEAAGLLERLSGGRYVSRDPLARGGEPD